MKLEFQVEVVCSEEKQSGYIGERMVGTNNVNVRRVKHLMVVWIHHIVLIVVGR